MDGVAISKAARRRRHALLDAYIQGTKQVDLARAYRVKAPWIWKQIQAAKRERHRAEELARERSARQLVKDEAV